MGCRWGCSAMFNQRSYLAPICLAAVWLAASLMGCGGGGGMNLSPPVSVSLVTPRVVVMRAGKPVTVLIQIQSPSETALVNVTQLPGGVGVKYAASDTNPSGTLTFTAQSTAVLGTFMPAVTVNSAGQTAMTGFTLVVEK